MQQDGSVLRTFMPRSFASGQCIVYIHAAQRCVRAVYGVHLCAADLRGGGISMYRRLAICGIVMQCIHLFLAIFGRALYGVHLFLADCRATL